MTAGSDDRPIRSKAAPPFPGKHADQGFAAQDTDNVSAGDARFHPVSGHAPDTATPDFPFDQVVPVPLLTPPNTQFRVADRQRFYVVHLSVRQARDRPMHTYQSRWGNGCGSVNRWAGCLARRVRLEAEFVSIAAPFQERGQGPIRLRATLRCRGVPALRKDLRWARIRRSCQDT